MHESSGDAAVEGDAGVVILSRTGEIVGEFPAELGLSGDFWPDSGLMTDLLRTDQPAYSDVLVSTVFQDKDVVGVIVPIIKTGLSPLLQWVLLPPLLLCAAKRLAIFPRHRKEGFQ